MLAPRDAKFKFGWEGALPLVFQLMGRKVAKKLQIIGGQILLNPYIYSAYGAKKFDPSNNPFSGNFMRGKILESIRKKVF